MFDIWNCLFFGGIDLDFFCWWSFFGFFSLLFLSEELNFKFPSCILIALNECPSETTFFSCSECMKRCTPEDDNTIIKKGWKKKNLCSSIKSICLCKWPLIKILSSGILGKLQPLSFLRKYSLLASFNSKLFPPEFC